MLKRIITLALTVSVTVYPLLNIQAATKTAIDSSGDELLLPPPDDNKLSAEQIDNLLAPIALYPDPLLAQIFPASTFVDQIDQAARFLRANNNQTTLIDQQNWDVSVKSIAHYPQIVSKMSEKLDWTTALGQAYVQQTVDVLNSVQRLRNRAKAAGYLVTTPQQTVIVEKEVIKIVPAQAQIIYVPTYNPQVVYVQQGPSTGEVVAATAIAFGVGLAIGAWLNNDCDWYGHRVYYHGWRGSGWVGYSSVHVRVNNNYYVNNRYNTVNVNRTVVNRNVNYNNINHYSNVNRNVNYNNVNRNNVNVNNVNRNNINTNNVNRNNVNTNNVNRNNVNNSNLNRNINSNTSNMDAYRGRTNPQATQNNANRTKTTQNNSAFGGNTNRAQTQQQSQRGGMSRQSAQTSRSKPEREKPQRSGGGGGRRRN